MNRTETRKNNILRDLFRFRIDRSAFSLSRTGPYITAFSLTVFIMLLVFIIKDFWPIGDRCFLRTDLYHQYAPFFRELKTKYLTHGSLEYDWNIGGGTNFWVLTAYYLASPLNVFVALVPSRFIIEFVTAMIVIKLGLCSVSMTYYLNSRHKKKGAEAYPAVIFGIFYALSGYMAAYQWNVMWLDCIWLFPLVILGLERLVRENKGMLYCFAYGMTVLSNYYIAIMVSMGIACYCFFLLGTEKKMRRDFGVKFLKFIGFTALGLMFAALFLAPYISYFGMTASADNNFKYEWYSYFSIFDMFSRHLLNVDVHTGLDHWPNIYCGVIIFVLLPLYYMNRKITLREKIGYSLLLLFFYFSFSTRAMDYIWHGFHIPNSLPCRQSFIYILIILTMCCRGFTGIQERTYRDLTAALLFGLLFVAASEKLMKGESYYHIYTFYVSALFIILYIILAYLHRKGRIHKDTLVIMVLTVVCVEACVNTCVTSVPTVSRSEYMNYDDGVHAIMEKIEADEGGDFFRAEKEELRTKNDAAWLTYPSVSTFSSVANARLTAFYKHLGLESSTNAYGSTGHTPFTNMLMGVKYIFHNRELSPWDSVRSLYDYSDGIYAYRNEYTLPLGFALPDNVEPRWSTSGNPMDNQNQLAGLVSDVYDLFVDVTDDYTSSTVITLRIPEDGFYYAYSPKSGPKQIKVTHGEYNKTFKNLNRSYTMDLGYLSAGTAVTFENAEDDSVKTLNITLYRFNDSKFQTVYEAFSKEPFEIDSFTDTEVNGHITVSEACTLWTTIASEKGWTVLVDGEETSYITLKDAYIGIPLHAGSHTVTLRYRTPYLTLGIILHILAILIFLLLFLAARFRTLTENLEEEEMLYSADSGFELPETPHESEPGSPGDEPFLDEPSLKEPDVFPDSGSAESFQEQDTL